MDQQVFILDRSFNPEITDELMVIYFDLNQEIFCITHCLLYTSKTYAEYRRSREEMRELLTAKANVDRVIVKILK